MSRKFQGKDGVLEQGVTNGAVEQGIGEMHGGSDEEKRSRLGQDAFAEGLGGGLHFQHVDAVIGVLEELFFCGLGFRGESEFFEGGG